MSWEETLTEQDIALGEEIARNGSRGYAAAAQQLGQSREPVKLAGQMAGLLVATLQKDAEAKGAQIPANAMKYAAKLIVEDMVEIAHKSGSLQVEGQQALTAALTQAFQQAIKSYASTQAEQAPQEQPQAGGLLA